VCRNAKFRHTLLSFVRAIKCKALKLRSYVAVCLLLLSGKIYLFILENTNCTNNTNPCGASPCLSHTNCTNTLRIIKNVLLTCASFGLRYKMPRTVIRVIRMRLAKKYPARWFVLFVRFVFS
jgi:hypothetical protein